MFAKLFRHIRRKYGERHSSILTTQRMGEQVVRNLNVLTRSLLVSNNENAAALIFEGLVATPGSVLDVNLSAPAVIAQKIEGDDIAVVIDSNGGVPFNVILETADATHPRKDIIEAQLSSRTRYTDRVDIADPLTKTITTATFDRDFEIYLTLQRKSGVAGVSPVVPNPTAATQGILTGGIITDVLDLSVHYLLNLAFGEDGEYIEVDLRGGTPSATTRAERMNAINTAFTALGTVAYNVGGAIELRSPGVGEKSAVRVRQPSIPSADAYAVVLNGVETGDYYDTFPGANAFFKVCEVNVAANATTLSGGDVFSRALKDTDWTDDADTIINALAYDAHRRAAVLDHADESIYLRHLNQEVLDAMAASLITATEKVTPVDADFTGYIDSADSFTTKKVSFKNQRRAIATQSPNKATPVLPDRWLLSDSEDAQFLKSIGGSDFITFLVSQLDAVYRRRASGIIYSYGGIVVPSWATACDGGIITRSAPYDNLFAAMTLAKGTVTLTIANPGVVSLTSHGFATGDCISLSTSGSLPTGVSPDTNFFVVFKDVDSFWLATTYQRALDAVTDVTKRIVTTGSQAGTHSLLYNPWGISGAASFYKPDFRGVTLKGAGQQGTASWGGTDYVGGLGWYIQDALQGHKHAITDPGHAHDRNILAGGQGFPAGTDLNQPGDTPSGGNTLNANTGVTVQNPTIDGTNGTPRTGKITQGPSAGVNYIITL